MVRDAPKRKGLVFQLDAVIFMCVIAILAGIMSLYFSNFSTEAKVARCKSELSTIAVAVNQYAYEVHEMPDFQKLSATKKYPADNGIEYGPWLHTSKPVDPWKQEYHLEQTADKKGYVIYSIGPKGEGAPPNPTDITAGGSNQLLGIYVDYDANKVVKTIAYYGRFGEKLD